MSREAGTPAISDKFIQAAEHLVGQLADLNRQLTPAHGAKVAAVQGPLPETKKYTSSEIALTAIREALLGQLERSSSENRKCTR
jgi:hypothetical protein